MSRLRFDDADRVELRDRLGEPPAISVLCIAQAYRQPGENDFDTLERLLLHEAMLKHDGSQIDVARELGTYPAMICRKLKNYIAQRKHLRVVR